MEQPQDRPRTTVVSVRLTPPQVAKLAALAGLDGTSPGGWLRAQIEAATINPGLLIDILRENPDRPVP